MGTWLNRDPIAEKGGFNLFGYVSNNPLFRVDVLGLAEGDIRAYENAKLRTEENFKKALANGELNKNAEKAVSIDVFLSSIEGKSLNAVKNESNIPTYGSTSGAPGPQTRFVLDPSDPANRVIDMRHFLVLGDSSKFKGDMVEVYQYLHPNRSIRNSAFEYQDLYSNALGREFFKQYDYSRSFEENLRLWFEKRRGLRTDCN